MRGGRIGSAQMRGGGEVDGEEVVGGMKSDTDEERGEEGRGMRGGRRGEQQSERVEEWGRGWGEEEEEGEDVTPSFHVDIDMSRSSVKLEDDVSRTPAEIIPLSLPGNSVSDQLATAVAEVEQLWDQLKIAERERQKFRAMFLAGVGGRKGGKEGRDEKREEGEGREGG
mmetsp:Transcript_15368/g.38848  ORF Transcript_15368/g.38848 Transcript_15368/m.38848 type:complete len:169 (+) Transcript_15368:2-508(+)